MQVLGIWILGTPDPGDKLFRSRVFFFMPGIVQAVFLYLFLHTLFKDMHISDYVKKRVTGEFKSQSDIAFSEFNDQLLCLIMLLQ
jgi:hypothetical protein